MWRSARIAKGDLTRMPITGRNRVAERDRNMATILEFRQAQTHSASQRRGGRTPAEIVFFPGVRYERRDEAPASKPKKRARRRDKLELND